MPALPALIRAAPKGQEEDQRKQYVPLPIADIPSTTLRADPGLPIRMKLRIGMRLPYAHVIRQKPARRFGIMGKDLQFYPAVAIMPPQACHVLIKQKALNTLAFKHGASTIRREFISIKLGNRNQCRHAVPFSFLIPKNVLMETLSFFVWRGASLFSEGAGLFVLPLLKKGEQRSPNGKNQRFLISSRRPRLWE